MRRCSALAIAAVTLLALFGVPSEAPAADLVYDPYGTWNGFKVYLSPARHSDSGGRGECGSLGENDLAYYVATDATNGNYYNDVYDPSSTLRNLRARGYKVRIGQGTVTSAYQNSNSWGADLHIPLHSNADVRNQCSRTDPSRFGTVVIYWYTSSGGPNLAAQLRDKLGILSGERSPGTRDQTCANPTDPCTTITLAELRYTSATAAYVESEFHTWTTGYNWLYESWVWAWRIGYAVDVHLNYP